MSIDTPNAGSPATSRPLTLADYLATDEGERLLTGIIYDMEQLDVLQELARPIPHDPDYDPEDESAAGVLVLNELVDNAMQVLGGVRALRDGFAAASSEGGATAKPARVGTRMGRKEFNGFLYDLYGCQGNNHVVADVVYESERYILEVFEASPNGLMIALHHHFGKTYGLNFNRVDVFQPARDVPRGSIDNDVAVAVSINVEAAV